MEKREEGAVPEQQTGAASNTVSSKTFTAIEEASQFYEVVKKRLFAVNKWHDWAGKGTAVFYLTDDKGNSVDRAPQKGDHFKIDIPGPGPVSGDGYDWVQVEAIEENKTATFESITIRVRPATNPTNSRQDVAHFFSEEATSSFQVRREGTAVFAEVHGRNEKPNTKAETIADKARNTAVATGAVSGFSKLQWKSLVNGLVAEVTEERKA